MKCVMESHEAKNPKKLLALVFICLAACWLQREREMKECLDTDPHMVA